METTERVCPVCGTTYQADPKRLKHGRQTTCSRACSYAFRMQTRKLPTGERRPYQPRTTPGPTLVTLTCSLCGEEFRRAPAHIAKVRHGHNFCSRKCHYAARSAGIVKRVVSRPYEYTPEGKAAIIASASLPKGKRVFHWITCTNCGVTFDDPTDGSRSRRSGMKFCSLDCCNDYRKGENNPAWRGGHPKYYGPDWRPLRRAARLRDGHCCRRCGTKPKRAVPVHHIIPVVNFENANDANTLDNVICLCPSCHMYVEWHGLDFTP
jgi:hypothetical protein